ncbi:MAG: tRNA1(Val) (adenine(37)-N6)-methyltransferase [Alphaproteobacteria bacterium]
MKKVINTLLGGKVKICQFETGVKVSSDAVLLASAVDNKIIKNSAKILDVGVGGGGISLCLLSRFDNVNILGIDIQDEMLELANESLKENHFEDRFSVIKEDILTPSKNLKDMEFDIVITNPPYYKGQTSPDKIKAKAHSEQGLNLNDWITSSVKRLRTGGTFLIIHKADRVDDIIYSLKKNNLGGIEIFPINSKKNENANRVIVRAKKSYKSPAIIYKPIILHKDDGQYSIDAKKILEKGASLTDIIKQ